jgi:hypothetical protein
MSKNAFPTTVMIGGSVTFTFDVLDLFPRGRNNTCVTFQRCCVAPLLFAAVIAAPSSFAAGERNTFDPRQFSTGNFHKCPPAGRAKRFDPYLDTLKNRDIPPATARRYTVSQMISALPTSLPTSKLNRSHWSSTNKDTAAKSERRGVTVEGYLIGVRKEKAEACNCGSTTYVDHHLWLASTPSSSKSSSMVVEVSPRSWRAHPSWRSNKPFLQIIHAKAKVRISGWLTWDQEHKEQLGNTRRTLWEVHPIHSIQVLRGGQWVAL